VVTQSLFQVLGLAAIVAASGLALEDVDVKAHMIFPDGFIGNALINHFVASSILGYMQKESPSQDEPHIPR